MEIITSHNALDFDGLASMVAAGKLYPQAVKVFSGNVSRNVKRFMSLYKDSLVIKSIKEIDLQQVKRVIVVDTANVKRLARMQKLFERSDLDIHIYDHHPPAAEDLQGSVHEVHAVGAATTILVEKIIEQGMEISPFEATILVLGIYADTGSLLFQSTTARDAYVVSYLLDKGANLEVVASFMEKSFSEEQVHLLQDLLETARRHTIKQVDILLAYYYGNQFIGGLDAVTYQLLEMENCSAVFVLARMEGKINIVGRSRSNEIRVNEALAAFGGRGHDKAASVIVKNKELPEVEKLLLQQVESVIRPPAVARDIMSSPVKTITEDFTMEEAGRLMLRYGHTGMPVVDGKKMIGVISRRDVDKATLHNLGHAPVKGFMTTRVLSVAPETSVSDIQRLMVEYDIGRLPVIDQDRLVGIVSRTDILRTLHGEDAPEAHKVLFSFTEARIENYSHLMKEQLPGDILNILQLAGEVAQEINATAYCVGGFVRDLFLQVPNFDVDIVVEGDGLELARRLGVLTHARVREHERFRTAVLIFPDGMKIDIATSRTEYYEFPAALPMVERSSIKEDMYRRDFTINTMALCLNPDKFGDLTDYFGGRKDLENGDIRVLYNLSFVEDPTRILRAIRFEQRYDFTIEPDTFRFARDAIERRMLGKLSYTRILNELILILNEKDPVPALERMVETGVWQYILPEVKLDSLSRTDLRRTPVVLSWWDERYPAYPVQHWLVYIVYILSVLEEEDLNQVLERYPFDRYELQCIHESRRISQLVSMLQQENPMPFSAMYRMLHSLNTENLIHLLLKVDDAALWDHIVDYIDARERMEICLNGNDLIALGLKPGPQFRLILEELYALKLDGLVESREAELDAVQNWITEGRFKHGMVD